MFQASQWARYIIHLKMNGANCLRGGAPPAPLSKKATLIKGLFIWAELAQIPGLALSGRMIFIPALYENS